MQNKIRDCSSKKINVQQCKNIESFRRAISDDPSAMQNPIIPRWGSTSGVHREAFSIVLRSICLWLFLSSSQESFLKILVLWKWHVKIISKWEFLIKRWTRTWDRKIVKFETAKHKHQNFDDDSHTSHREQHRHGNRKVKGKTWKKTDMTRNCRHFN